jgi:stringent starvation protein B
MVTTKPYLIRAIYEWCVDEGFTPYLSVLVDARTRVPREYVKDGQIVLNVGREATSKLLLGNEEITFQARFNGAAFPVQLPVGAVAAIYARENGQGMAFEPEVVVAAEEGTEPQVPAGIEPAPPQSPGGRPHLTRVK